MTRLVLALLTVLLLTSGVDAQTLRAKQFITTDGQGSILQPPRMTLAQRNASSHRNGEIIYCTDCTPVGEYVFVNGAWVFSIALPSPSTSSAGDFLLVGTTTTTGLNAGGLRLLDGLVVGAPTGDGKGAGTINAAGAYYANGTIGTTATYTMCKTGACITTCTIVTTNGIVTSGTCNP